MGNSDLTLEIVHSLGGVCVEVNQFGRGGGSWYPEASPVSPSLDETLE